MMLRSLDHQGIQVKQADKRNFSAKHLIDGMKTKYEEQRRQRSTKSRAANWQYTHEFSDQDVITDVLRFMILYATNAPQHNGPERRRIAAFFREFIQVFFGLEPDMVEENLRDLDERGSPEDEEETPAELTNGKTKRLGNGKKPSLLQKTLTKSAPNGKGRSSKEDSAAGSKESTPDVDSVGEDEGAETAEEQAATRVTNERWLNDEIMYGTEELRANKEFVQSEFKLFCNQTIFIFFSVFQTLYRRLKEIKGSEQEAREEGVRASKHKPARDIGLLQEREDYYSNMEENESYYSRTLGLVEDFITGEVEEPQYTSSLRQYYLSKGWQLFTISDHLKHMCRLGATCSGVDPKEKTPDILTQFYENRKAKEAKYDEIISIRKQAEKFVKDGELFVISWVCIPPQHLVLF